MKTEARQNCRYDLPIRFFDQKGRIVSADTTRYEPIRSRINYLILLNNFLSRLRYDHTLRSDRIVSAPSLGV
jgi:hypothetical protein